VKDFWIKVRNSFFAGLLLVVPVAVSIGIVYWLFTKFTDFLLPKWLRSWLQTFPYPEILYRLIALLVFVVLVTVIGWVTRRVIGKRMVVFAEQIIARVPLLNKTYGFMKEVSHTLLSGQKTVFERVVLVEYPRPGLYAIGFITSETEGEIQHKTQQDVVNVFLPTTPNPTSGFLLMVPREQVVNLQMTVAEGMKLVISGGAVVPPYTAKTQQPAPPPVR
jgi:uncharacterized membrane protein